MRAAPALCAVALAALVTCGRPTDDPVVPPVDLARLAPPLGELPGWSIVEGPEEFRPETLFEPLDGGAPVYLDHGFRLLRRTVYRLGADPRASIMVDVFDMGSVLGAFGIYRASLPEGVVSQPWGAEGHRVGSVAAAWRGRIYLRAEAGAESPELVAALDRVVATVSLRIPGEARLPGVLQSLPLEGLIPRSERYVSHGLYGHSFLPGGIVAGYLLDGRRAEVFFSDLGSHRAARRALERLRTFHGAAATEAAVAIGDGGFRFRQAATEEAIVVRAGSFVAGIRGATDDGRMHTVLSRLAGNLGGA